MAINSIPSIRVAAPAKRPVAQVRLGVLDPGAAESGAPGRGEGWAPAGCCWARRAARHPSRCFRIQSSNARSKPMS